MEKEIFDIKKTVDQYHQNVKEIDQDMKEKNT
jgi:hypothetical protein